LERLAKIARETQKQCEIPTASTIHPPQPLFSWLDEMTILPGRKIFLDEEATEPRLTPEILRPPVEEYIFLVGPEGGWAPEEREKILQCGFQSVSLGLKLLKTETAALYAMILLDATLGN
jgi:16S rRNA (uracil1498-N3)-methyltransferase